MELVRPRPPPLALALAVLMLAPTLSGCVLLPDTTSSTHLGIPAGSTDLFALDPYACPAPARGGPQPGIV